jgi:hypothetical protein
MTPSSERGTSPVRSRSGQPLVMTAYLRSQNESYKLHLPMAVSSLAFEISVVSGSGTVAHVRRSFA